MLKDIGYTMTLRGVETSASALYDALANSINTVYEDVVEFGEISREHEDEYELFHNAHKVVDGPW